MSWDSFLVSFWEVFGGLGVTFGGIRGVGISSKSHRNFEDSRGPQDLRQYAKWKVRRLSRLAVNNHQPGYKTVRYKLQGCKLSNLRISEDAHVSSNITEHYKAVYARMN